MNTKTTIRATFQIPLNGLANHMNKFSFPDSVIAMLKKEPLEAELVVLQLLKNYVRAIKADIVITSMRFRELDSENVTHAIVYFDFTVKGSKAAITKAVGKEKFIQYAKA